jgi:hypothetical protein
MSVHAAQHARAAPQWHFKAAGAFVPKATAECLRKHGFHMADIILNWRTIVGEDLARYTAPSRIKWPRHTNNLDAEDPEGRVTRPARTALELWVDGGRALDVQYRAKQIIDRVNTYFGCAAITELRILQGPVGGPAEPPKASAKPARAEPHEAALPDGHGIAHEPLRAALGRLGVEVRRRLQAALPA